MTGFEAGASDDQRTRSWALGALLYPDCESSHLYDLFFGDDPGGLRQGAWRLRDELRFFDIEEQLLIKAALDIWSGNGHLYLFEMLEHWDQREWLRFIKSISILKGISIRSLLEVGIGDSEELF